MSTNFDKIRKEGRLLYEYIRGSTLYGLNTPQSDVDTSGVFICNPSQVLGLRLGYQPQVQDSKHDNVWYELENWLRLLLKSNPTMLESLFIPQDKIIGEVHPYVQEILAHRDEFISKECFKPFFGYAVSQIEKARGLNKMIVNPIKERLQPLDFCYTFYNQGSTKIKNWLEYRQLQTKYCGLVKIPNMYQTYGLYYDWKQYFNEENITLDDLTSSYTRMMNDKYSNLIEFIVDLYNLRSEDNGGEYVSETCTNISEWFDNLEVIGYRGMLNSDGTANELRLSSVAKGEKPLCHITYNDTGYTKHCIDYKNYKTWEKERNPSRYESNLNKNYDSKNMMHCMRMIHMATEIANGNGIILDRNVAGDRDFLMKIRNHQFEYDEIMDYVESAKEKMNNIMKSSTIRDKVDSNIVDNLLINIRKKQLGL